MRITNRRLCRIGTGRGFYVPDKYLSDEHIDEYFDLEITPVKQDIDQAVDSKLKLNTREQSIRDKLLDLMKQHPNSGTWLIPEFAIKVMEWLNISYDEAKKDVELLLPKISEIEKVYPAKFRNFFDGSGYKLKE